MSTKNCPETARQKMINMMYLVLTAMLAMNVAAETLQAFKIVDRSLINTYIGFTNKNDSALSNFRAQNALNEKKVGQWLEKAERAAALSDSIIEYLLETKEILAYGANAYKLEPGMNVVSSLPLIEVRGGDTLVLEKQDDLNISPEVMITKGRGNELQSKILEYRDNMIEICTGYDYIAQTLTSYFDVDDSDKSGLLNGTAKSWVTDNFQTTPVIAAVTLLSKLQIDVRNAESLVLTHLYSQIDASSFKFTGLEAKVIPTSTYVFEGQTFEAKIFLSAVDTTTKLQAYMSGSSNPLPVENNEALYKVTCSKAGFYDYKGEILYKTPEGGEGKKSFMGSYQVAVPNVTISPTKMNVLYQNVKNPISISVPGVANDKLEVTFSNGKITKVSAYEWDLEPSKLDPKGDNTKVIVMAEVDGKKQKMGEMIFRVKKIPDPKATVASMTEGSIDREKLKLQRGIFAKLEDFDFDMSFEVTSFDLSVAASGGMTTTLSSSSYKFTGDMQSLLGNLGAGSKVSFENIKARMAGNPKDPERSLSPIVLTVK